MKKIFLLLFSVLTVASVFAQKITKTYRFNDLKIEKIGDYSLISFNNCLQSAKPGQALLPYSSVKLLLPPGTKAEDVKITYQDKIEIPGNFILYPKQYVRPVSYKSSGEFVKDENFYASSAEYGESDEYIFTTEYMNGYSFGFTSFTPLRYVPSTGKLYYYKTVTVEMSADFEKESGEALNMISGKENILNRVRAYADNPEDISLYPQNKSSRSDDYEVLIISGSTYESSFENLRAIYAYRGMRSEFKAVSEITGSMPGIDGPEKIRNYIIQEYTDHNIEYVLLAGDTEIVPYRGFYCEVQSSSVYTDDDIPSDLYYSALDGTWNDDSDDLWGETDEDDLLPEISVARMPFSNNTELSKMLNKVTMYQEDPITDELDNPLLAGEHLYDYPLTWGGDYLDLLVGYHDDNGYETTGIPETDPYVTMYARDQSWGYSDIIAAINSGHPFIHHSGHSNTTYTMYLSSSDITNSNFSQVNGTTHNFPLVYTHGCICGDFSASDCIAEEMLKIDNFAVGFIGNSRYGWFNEGQTEGPSAHIHREFVDALYDKKENNIGTAHMISKYETAPWVTAPNQHEEGALRWCFYDCNALSDPTLPIWTAAPMNIDAVYEDELSIGIPYYVTVTNQSNPLEGIHCTVMKDGEVLGSAQTDDAGSAQINVDPVTATTGPAQLIITGYNCQKTTYDINIINNPNAVVVVESYEIIDNDNGLVDYDEEILFNMTFKNAGAQDATECTATLSSEDEYVVLAYCFADLGTIPAASSVFSEEELCLATTAYVPDQHSALLTVNTVCDQDEWDQDILININAPVIEIGSVQINELSGNGNGVFEGGETAEFTFNIKNTGHSISPGTMVNLSSLNGNISIENADINIGTVNALSVADAVFTLTASEDLLNGDTYSLICEAVSGPYEAAVQFNLVVGLADEDFETGDFTAFDWQFGGDADWIIVNNESNTGTYSARSGSIDDYESTSLEIHMDVLSDSEISFSRKVSSEDDYDYLTFYIDGDEKGAWSGEAAWAQETYPVTSGSHTFKWEYDKDVSLSGGSDMAWVDDIIFPLSGDTVHLPVEIHEIQSGHSTVNVYPNPFNEQIVFKYNLSHSSFVYLDIYTFNGILIDRIKIMQAKGENTLIWDNTTECAPGVYIYKLKTDEFTQSGKLIKTKR